MRINLERFEEKICPEPNTGCWLWTAGTFSTGYGASYHDGKMLKAHRASYELYCGKIPNEMCILHKCDTPPCVNPDHLYLGTSQENRDDKMLKNRQARHKLTSDMVVDIRKKYKDNSRYQWELAIEYNVSQALISCIVTNRIWRFT